MAYKKKIRHAAERRRCCEFSRAAAVVPAAGNTIALRTPAPKARPIAVVRPEVRAVAHRQEWDMDTREPISVVQWNPVSMRWDER